MWESIQNNILGMELQEQILIILFALLYLIQTVYMFLFSMRVVINKSESGAEMVPLSLLLVFRNEEENLGKNLPPILAAGNNDCEVIAVDNFSQDNSLEYLNSVKKDNPRLRVTYLKQEASYSEKMAQNIAMKAAGNDWVMAISPSMVFSNPHWLNNISKRLNGHSDVVINYSNVQPAPSFFNLLYRVEFFFQQLKSFGFILNGMPWVISQDNVAFRKQKYFEVGGYRGKITEPFANLELVINSFLKIPASLLLTAETAVRRTEDIQRKDYLELLKREANIKKFLPAGIQFLLSLFEWAHILLLPVTILLIILMPALWPVLTFLVISLIICNLLIINKLLNRLNERKLFLSSLLVALFLPLIKLFFRAGYSNYGRKKRWKKRK
jgi:glycosyltransferase involved in cell wall biosynthesis